MKSAIRFLGLAVALFAAAPTPVIFAQEPPPRAETRSAELKKLVAIIRPVGNSNVRGSVVYEKVDEGILITARVGGLTPKAHHAIHIHEFGDLGSDDASSAGEHFNPGGHPHAVPDDSERHAGDMGNLEADGDGNATLTLTVNNITLDAGKRGILGRAVIVHSKADDGGQPSGNAGERIGAGVIGVSKDAEQDPPTADLPSPPARTTGGKPAEPGSNEAAEE
jgi:Cu-Zn family superoxide dismutase